MDRVLSPEGQMLKDSIDKFLRQQYAFDKRRALADSELGFSEENWRAFADLG
ncbi:MAG: hypothetical protein OSA45_11220 [Halioglobus sp.]|nr:hypothetical protein [Halioglobus sp.]